MKQETTYMKLKRMKIERAYWNGRARMDTASLSATTKKAAEVELICAQLEAEIREKKASKQNTEFSQSKGRS